MLDLIQIKEYETRSPFYIEREAMKKDYGPVGDSWDDFEKKHFTQAEIDSMDAKISILHELIDAGNKGSITQEEFESLLKEQDLM